MPLLGCIVLCTLGLFAIIGPDMIYKIKESWKNSHAGEPSGVYKVYVRVVGSLLFVIGFGGILALLVFHGNSDAPSLEEIDHSGIETSVEK